jgi:hypothetical protein
LATGPSMCSNSFSIITLGSYPNRLAHTNSADEAKKHTRP